MENKSSKTIFRGAIGMAVGIILGALAAHALKEKLDDESLRIFEVAVRYQIYGCIGLILMGILELLTKIHLNVPVILMRIGIILFSGSIYFLALRPLMGIEEMGWVGAITPFGGVAMIASWVLIGIKFYNPKHRKQH
jgi:uncharacterized membrane protein YgdD (TMEM256/DUF423 family)